MFPADVILQCFGFSVGIALVGYVISLFLDWSEEEGDEDDA
ncbi:hypothetical protein [Archaeoglobus fulgidus]|jgi:hypothetical protein|uniref:Uncharacterized protein AF_1204 n=3 Tax=Archaeoglobus fulgidus TaxID=2234 RepID=Y1204_ARCFU|nr:hypothetical protein [Archaeoglobus fulgidus]O29064.1 RecName: Full=Uncharacterized protein AF_1204; Flags: Precursor [Archaeoglobus fulgidus DSM 4304]AAB90049.1 predicted coding region AF_1204 [Archaeoglobus fulgidus DSM 4304]AIG98078.1 hypothetical protein AFULGI_00013030 [Archaeoglobus fulgidus DSM 8774]KUJ93674.1 MAG: hypothetical protein XD40_1146 [Archaeoglobus fulgidus]KUK06135.1 MAG: Uncharacterized protein XD48_1630 [Archaeoglobus fulgidus]